jgi:hypothetical protein
MTFARVVAAALMVSSPALAQVGSVPARSPGSVPAVQPGTAPIIQPAPVPPRPGAFPTQRSTSRGGQRTHDTHAPGGAYDPSTTNDPGNPNRPGNRR